MEASRTLADLDEDSIAHCSSFLDRRDVLNLAFTCSHFRRIAYSDSVWAHLFRKRWPYLSPNPSLGVRKAYLQRHSALQQFKFNDPVENEFLLAGVLPSHIMLNKNDIIIAQGSFLQALKLESLNASETFRAHSARITSMRLFPSSYTSLCRTGVHCEEKVLVTSSADHTIRLWWKGQFLRCFKGHNCPVTTLGNKPLGDSNLKVLASGGEDGTIRLWSLSSGGKRGPLSTFHGHEKQISSLSVAGHNPSLLTSISKEAKMRVWDTSVLSATRFGPCVGMASVSGRPLEMKCHEALCYIGSDSSVTAIDLRTMQKAFTVAIFPQKLCAFEVLPPKSLLCAGVSAKAILWDIRYQRETEVISELEGHDGNVTMIHMDPYKIVTGGLFDSSVNVWATDTGTLNCSLPCFAIDAAENEVGLTGMAVDGYRIVTACWGGSSGVIRSRDFQYASVSKPSEESELTSKFWEGSSVE